MENLKDRIKKFFGESVSFGVSAPDMFEIELPFVDRNNDFIQIFIYKNTDKFDIVIVSDTKYDNHKFQFNNIEVEKDVVEGWDSDNLIIRNLEADKVCQNICNLVSEFLKAGG
jgi:hypothetical protein